MKKEEYYNFIKENNISDVLSLVEELSYSKKLEILKNLLIKYSIDSINYALFIYNKDYINLNCVDISIVEGTLIFLCKRGSLSTTTILKG